MIGIVDSNTGNLSSVYNSVYELGFDPVFIGKKSQLSGVSHLIIPGVGNYQEIANNIGLIKDVKGYADSNKIPLLGICLGMHVMGIGSEEGAGKGLGVFDEIVRKLNNAEVRVPHVGWNNVDIKKKHPVMNEVKLDRDFYFVHSYAYTSINRPYVVGISSHGQEFVSIAAKENYIGVQFHPEKSQTNGLKLIENFCLWDGVYK